MKYGGITEAIPLHTIGQGNGYGPTMWTSLDAVINEIMIKLGCSSELISPISKSVLRYLGFGFVDDMDNTATAKLRNETDSNVASRMQATLDLRNGLVCATGGLISAEKSFWYLIGFKWKDGEWAYKTIDDSPASLTIKDDTGKRHEIKRHEVWHAEETLGTFIAPDGSNNRAIEAIYKKITTCLLYTSPSPRD